MHPNREACRARARPRANARAFAFLALGLIASVPSSLLAVDPSKSILQFNCYSWTRQSGLPADTIHSIVQSADGFIWLGTQHGAIRFDGREFVTMPLAATDGVAPEVRNLATAREGGLWLALDPGGFARYQDGVITPVAEPPWNDAAAGAHVILATPSGELWTGSELGFGRWSGSQASARFFDHTLQAAVHALAVAPSGRIWVGTVENGLHYFEQGRRHAVADERLQSLSIDALAVDREERVWVGTQSGLFCYDVAGRPVEIPQLSSEIKALLVDRHGVLWVATTGMGVARYHKGKFTHLLKINGLASDHATALFEDAEGSVWVGTPQGLSQITDLKFPTFGAGEGLITNNAIAVTASRRGGLWIGTNQGLSYLDGDNTATYGSEVLPHLYVRRVLEMRNGDLVLVDGDRSIVFFADGRVQSRVASDVWPEALAEDAESLLAGVGPTLVRVRPTGLEPYAFSGAVPKFYWINCLHVARDGAIWVASNHGVHRVRDGTFRSWGVSDGLPAERVQYIFEDDDGHIWAGLDAGLVRIKEEQLRAITSKDGLWDERIYAIVPDDRGYFWFSSSQGYFRAARSELNQFADGTLARVHCDTFTGLGAVKFADRDDQSFSGCRTNDGRIWFPTPQGVVMIDPVNFVQNPVPPPVLISEVKINDVVVEPRADLRRLRSGDDRIEFRFAALSYLSPDSVRVQYQLKGLDATWVEAGQRRMALYANLRPGAYTFRVRASNADGVWNEVGDSYVFELPPPFHQTPAFIAAACCAALLALFGIYRWKVRRMRRHEAWLRAQNDELEAKVAARTRQLAREHELLRTLLDNSPDQIYFKDLQSRFLEASRAESTNLRVSPEDLKGKTDFDFFDEAHARPAFEDEQQIIRTGEPVIGKVEREVHKDGRATWVLTSKMPLRNAAGEIIGTFGISKNITEIKETELRLAELNRQFLETSRRAGMAEVATSVLHNVGNVLNSINISTTLVAERVGGPGVSHLARTCALLRQHESELGSFFTVDPRGRQVLGFLESLAAHFSAEQAALLKEMESLRHNVEHVREIVEMQQSYARISGVAEEIGADELVEDALRMNAAALSRHNVEVVRDYQARPRLTVEKHKVLQILVNVIRNAKYACDDSGRADKRVTVRITADATTTALAVIDNGVGIRPENLTRIFSHGFTTRKNGHGFGLHSGALAARELKGALEVQSEGMGCGAVFTLRLPLSPPAAGARPEPRKSTSGEEHPAGPAGPAEREALASCTP